MVHSGSTHEGELTGVKVQIPTMQPLKPTLIMGGSALAQEEAALFACNGD